MFNKRLADNSEIVRVICQAVADGPGLRVRLPGPGLRSAVAGAGAAECGCRGPGRAAANRAGAQVCGGAAASQAARAAPGVRPASSSSKYERAASCHRS
jgi:hypothetical protein